MTEVERITALETRMTSFEKTMDEVNNKLDDLLALKNKGMGAFWLASTLMGVGLTVLLSFVTDWFK